MKKILILLFVFMISTSTYASTGAEKIASGKYSHNVNNLIASIENQSWELLNTMPEATHTALNNEGLYIVSSPSIKTIKVLTSDELCQFCMENWLNHFADVVAISKKEKAEVKKCEIQIRKAIVAKNMK